jgi:hypothetical protein
MFRIFIFLIFLLPVSCFAQYTISGRVLNQADTKPVANASVFLSNASVGSKTADDGIFTLHDAKPGKYELLISIIGFETYSQTIMVNGNIKLPDITIFPKSIALNEVKIKPDDRRDDYYEQFKNEFLGTSALAKQCKILNPEILDLAYDAATGTLTASTTDFLEIENEGLGYKIRYLLTSFTLNDKTRDLHYQGYDLFEEMKGTPEQEQLWQKKRQEVYEGSSMHFLRSALNNRIEEEGFRVLQLALRTNPERPPQVLIDANIKYYKESQSGTGWKDSLTFWERKQKLTPFFQTLMHTPLSKQDIITPTKQPGIYMLSYGGDALHITYNKNHRFSQKPLVDHLDNPGNTSTTIVNFNSAGALFDANGGILNPADVAFTGVWINNRIAELLPLDYESPQNKANVDSTVSKSIIAKLKAFSNDHIIEKAYLQFDKPFYVPGDTIYFKAYVTAGERHLPSAISGVLYADLISGNNKIEKTIKLQVTDGVTWGDFVLPDSLQGAGYQVRAYTQWIRNQGEATFFTQNIPIASIKKITETDNTIKSSEPAQTAKPDIQFMPEGGNLVTGIRSKVAFKATDVDGLGVDVKGVIVDNEGKEITSITSAHLGMGYFYLNPAEGRTYQAKLTYANGAQDEVLLPAANNNGITISVTSDSLSKVFITLNCNKAFFKENKDKSYTVIVYSGGLASTLISKLDNPSVTADILKSDLRSGTAAITLFSPTGEPLAERLIYIENNDQLTLKVSSSKIVYATGEKVNIKLSSLNNTGDAVVGHFSVSVTDESKVPADENAERTIFNYLLFTSELKGYIEQPNYYFMGSDKARANLDILMLTQGYRQFEWKQVLNNASRTIAYKPEKALTLAGKVKTPSGQPVPDSKVSLFAVKENLLRDTVTDINGNFKFSDLYLSDTSKLLIRARKDNNDSNIKIEITQPDYPEPVIKKPDSYTTKISPQAIMAMPPDELSEKNSVKLQQVNVKSSQRLKTTGLSYSSNLHGPGQADEVVMGDKLGDCINLSDCLLSKIPGVTFKDGKLYTSRELSHINMDGQGKTRIQSMMVIVDGSIMDGSQINNVNTKDVYSVKVLTSGANIAVYGSEAAGGVLVITTKRDGSTPAGYVSSAAPGMINYVFKGFYKAREFYSPKYNGPETGVQNVDLRSTIFWKPDIVTGTDGKATFEYFNGGAKGTYRVVVEGMDDNGSLGRQVFRYKVE